MNLSLNRSSTTWLQLFRKYSRGLNSSASVIEEELRKFSAIGSNWWDDTSAAGASPLHSMNPLRVQFIRSCLSSKLKRERWPFSYQLRDLEVLDVGCGGGLLTESMARLGARVTGIDPSARNIEVSNNHAIGDPLTANINYQQTTIEAVASSAKKYDVITCLEVVEHVKDLYSFLFSCSQCLKEGGSIFLSTINRTVKSYMMTIAAAEYLLRIVPRGTHEWNKYITPSEIRTILCSQKVNAKIDKINGLIVSPDMWTKSLKWTLSGRDHDVNYILHAVKNVGNFAYV